jgi:hypothetical protein
MSKIGDPVIAFCDAKFMKEINKIKTMDRTSTVALIHLKCLIEESRTWSVSLEKYVDNISFMC